MAFIAKQLTSHQLSPSVRTAHYRHDADTQANMRAANYFNAAWEALPKGTILTCVAEAGTATPTVCNYIVTASSAAGVTIALQTVA